MYKCQRAGRTCVYSRSDVYSLAVASVADRQVRVAPLLTACPVSKTRSIQTPVATCATRSTHTVSMFTTRRSHPKRDPFGESLDNAT
jgi:hypothetical protein